MTPLECVRATAGAIGRTGGLWMFDAQVHARGADHGLDFWSWYHCGRGGVLGDGGPEAVVAAFGFFPPERQAAAWVKGSAVRPVTETARLFAQECAAFGERTFPADARLAALVEKVTDAASPMGLPVFAGWRTLGRSIETSDAGRLALALQVAREHRGGAHLVAVAAQAVTPLQAVMSGRYGAPNAQLFGWPEPWPAPETAREQMAAAEAMTDRIVEPAFAVLDDDERAELAERLRALNSGDRPA